ncbi:PREDICTED: 60S ribosomal protein L6-like [Acropora digitifera]|uniref:60S ribosomal protein L6-like n=1 Tax=Acropora digitifera TaxID=70779 RepID=UPI00077A43D0|nr:PREDICTED: 60S ribosomal protein L6-like [Acropora digitifera]
MHQIAPNPRVKCKSEMKGNYLSCSNLGSYSRFATLQKAIFLKQLTSGLLLVTGPSKLSQVPLKRVKQQYVIATKTKIDIGDFQLPDGLTDELFKRKAKKRKRNEDMFTEETQEDEKPSQEFVEKQEAVDEHILAKIAEVEHLELYMETPFSLKKGQYPHAMIF